MWAILFSALMALPLSVSVPISGVDTVLDRIGGIQERMEDLAPALSIVADLLEAHVAQNFKTQGVQSGSRWAVLAPTTVLARTKRTGYYGQRSPTAGAGPTSPVLVWSGRLRRSFARGGVAHIRQITSSSLIWGSGVRYGVFHQSTAPRAKLPRRAPLAFRDPFQRREITFQPLRLWLQGVPPGAIRTTIGPRVGLGFVV